MILASGVAQPQMGFAYFCWSSRSERLDRRAISCASAIALLSDGHGTNMRLKSMMPSWGKWLAFLRLQTDQLRCLAFDFKTSPDLQIRGESMMVNTMANKPH